jgi:2-(1,2-epoxy-1,2-dihydrophenyl)acetyl-CoA isomerase
LFNQRKKLIDRFKESSKMEKKPNFDENYDFFSAKRLEDVVILRFKENLLFQATDLGSRDKLVGYLNRVSESDSIKVVVIISSSGKRGSEEYLDFYHQALEPKQDRFPFHRIHNVFAQLIMRIISLNKIVIHANRGRVIPLFLNVSLACDYRIIAENTVFQNPYLKVGLIPIGGGAFLLSKMLGPSKAFKILLSGNDITAYEAMKLGIVHEVIPVNKLEETAIDAAQCFALKPARSLTGVKRLINYTMKDFKEYMEFEQKEFVRIVRDNRLDANFTTNSYIGI